MRAALVVGGVVLAVLIIDYLSVVLVPFFVAWFLAYLINPVVDFFQHRVRLKYRGLAMAATLLLLGGIITGLILLIMPAVVADCHRFIGIVDNYLRRGSYNTQVEDFIAQYFSQINVGKLLRDGQFLELVKAVMPRMMRFLQHTAGFGTGNTSVSFFSPLKTA